MRNLRNILLLICGFASGCAQEPQADRLPAWDMDALFSVAKEHLGAVGWEIREIQEIEVLAWYEIEDD
jgi:hypothetical protein